jgi:hypothetical protein
MPCRSDDEFAQAGLIESRIARITRRPKQLNRANREALYKIAESRNTETFFRLCREVVHHRVSHMPFCLRARVPQLYSCL